MILHILATVTALQPAVVQDNAQLTVADVSRTFDDPWALGEAANVRRAATAARQCGMTGISVRHYPRGRAMLVTRGRNQKRAEKCMSRWLKSHEKSFDPLLGIE